MIRRLAITAGVLIAFVSLLGLFGLSNKEAPPGSMPIPGSTLVEVPDELGSTPSSEPSTVSPEPETTPTEPTANSGPSCPTSGSFTDFMQDLCQRGFEAVQRGSIRTGKRVVTAQLGDGVVLYLARDLGRVKDSRSVEPYWLSKIVCGSTTIVVKHGSPVWYTPRPEKIRSWILSNQTKGSSGFGNCAP